MWYWQGLAVWLGLSAVFTLGWVMAALLTEDERIDPTAPQPPLDAQDVALLLSLCEQAMEDEPYTSRAVFLCRLIDRLEDWQLSL